MLPHLLQRAGLWVRNRGNHVEYILQESKNKDVITSLFVHFLMHNLLILRRILSSHQGSWTSSISKVLRQALRINILLFYSCNV
jgi:hypothetical protein